MRPAFDESWVANFENCGNAPPQCGRQPPRRTLMQAFHLPPVPACQWPAWPGCWKSRRISPSTTRRQGRQGGADEPGLHGLRSESHCGRSRDLLRTDKALSSALLVTYLIVTCTSCTGVSHAVHIGGALITWRSLLRTSLTTYSIVRYFESSSADRRRINARPEAPSFHSSGKREPNVLQHCTELVRMTARCQLQEASETRSAIRHGDETSRVPGIVSTPAV